MFIMSYYGKIVLTLELLTLIAFEVVITRLARSLFLNLNFIYFTFEIQNLQSNSRVTLPYVFATRWHKPVYAVVHGMFKR